MDCLSAYDPTEEVVVMKGSQLGFTEAGSNWIGYIMDHVPGPMLAVQPTVDMAKRVSRQRIDPLIEDTKALQRIVKSPRSRDSGNTILSKEFPGGILILTGANSAVGLRSMPVRYLFLDEIDGYPGDVDGEGDPIDLATARTRTFSRRKIFEPSTPTVEGLSKIDAKFKASDQRYFWVPCPHCQHEQTLRFTQLRWPKGEPDKAHYVCEHCEAEIQNHHKTWMLERGRWIKQFPENRIAGFHLSSLYSPVGWFSWADVARAWDAAQSDPSKLKVVVNTILAETWKEKGERPDWEKIKAKAEKYEKGVVQPGGLFLTAGCDVQKDRLEIEVLAWGRGKTSWSVDYVTIPGDTSTEGPWDELEKLLARDWPMLTGQTLPIMLLAVDTGYRPQMAYKFCGRHPNPAHGPSGSRVYAPRSVMPVKGDDNRFKLISAVSTVSAARKRRGLKIVSIGTPVAKQELYDWLRLPVTDGGFLDGYCHVPEYEDSWFQGICAEQRIVTDHRGHARVEWRVVPLQVGNATITPRNEPLDARVYNRGAASVIGIDRFTDKHWAKLEADLGVTAVLPAQKQAPEQPAPKPQPPVAPVNAPPAQPRRPSGWLGDRSGWLRRR